MAERFGDNGITGCIMINGNEIDTFLLSCRILGKGIEKAFVKQILQELRNHGLTELKAAYLPTAKNSQVADFYDKCGFELVSEAEGAKSYQIDMAKADLEIEKYYHINMK